MVPTSSRSQISCVSLQKKNPAVSPAKNCKLTAIRSLRTNGSLPINNRALQTKMQKTCCYFPYCAILIAGLLILACQQPQETSTTESNEFSRNIRTTDPLSPEEERLALHLPPGFEIQLFASEPDIAKPLNMSFDNRGRMWLTQSYEYPFPDTSGAGKDKITILEDTDGDGTADKISVFADSLNIPIGIQVVPDGVITYSIPHIWHLFDHDKDDKVDERKVLYTGFKYGDTHGMVNNFVRSWDGWIHADHGFSNTSTVAGSDGDTIIMQSGNTFRFRMDGSRVEFTTTGRVNPYGYAYDELGYTYSVDCHTSPVYQLIRGADYPHFGKKPTGIGFGPALMRHDYGSTALAGLEYYIAEQFPPEFRYNFYYGDVVRSRVSRNNFQMRGTTPVIHQEEDFIISDDPWFRPVDVKLGPDGALYIADFYNRIIGHYEVPLDHPGRDRQRGRIWRIIYTGDDHQVEPGKNDWSQLDLASLILQLNNPNLPLRMTFADQIVDRFGEGAVPELHQLIMEPGTPPLTRIQALWILYRLNGLHQNLLETAIRNENDTVKVHTLRICYEIKDLQKPLLALVRDLLNYPNPHVQRQAVMVISQHPDLAHVKLLLDLLKKADKEDTHFYYSIRQSMRDQIRSKPVLNQVTQGSWPTNEQALLADVMVGVDDPLAGKFLLHYLGVGDEEVETRKRYTSHAARWLSAGDQDQLITALERSGRTDPDEDYAIFLAMLEGIQQGAKPMGAAGKAWATRLATEFLQDPVVSYAGWRCLPIDRQPYPGNSWQVIDTTVAGSRTTFFSSNKLDGGGNGISILQSPIFKMPESLSFILRGQKNAPGEDQPSSPPTNRIILALSDDDSILETADITLGFQDSTIQWKTDRHIGKEVYLRLVDGSAARGEYIAIGQLEPMVVSLPTVSPEKLVDRQIFAAKMVQDYKLKSLITPLKEIVSADAADVLARNAAAKALLSLNEPSVVTSVKEILRREPPLKLKEQLLVSLSEHPSDQSRELITTYLQDIPYPAQKEVVMNLGGNSVGIEFLLNAAEKVQINPRLLLEPQVKERLQMGMNSLHKQRFVNLETAVKPPAGKIDDLINRRLRNYTAAAHSTDKGQAFFSVFCSTCHEINGQGGNIGPQLNGIGNWGARALSEKILDPNRNISKAFVTYTIRLKDGGIQSGLFRREEGQTLVFANDQGQEFSIDKNNIAEQKVSPYTLMPDHFRETIPEEDFKHLLAYLLSLKAG